MAILILLLIGLTPFSYASFGEEGARVIILQVFAAALIIAFKAVQSKRVHFNVSFIALLVLLVLVLAVSLTTSYYNEFLALSVFMTLSLAASQLDWRGSQRAISYYKASVIFVASGLIIQYAANLLLGLNLFRHDAFGGGRNAYSFLWEDYSFVSLFVVTGIPFFYQKKINIGFLLVASFLFVASLITSARTGVVALLLLCFLYVLANMAAAATQGRMRKSTPLIAAVILIAPIVFVYWFEELTGRQITVSSSGRVADFVRGYYAFLNNPLFGMRFDKVAYNETISLVPHNMFLYMLYMGGVVGFSIYVAWLVSAARFVKYTDARIKASILISLLGFQFVPSFFSAYFFAILLGVAFADSRCKMKQA